MNRHKQEHLHQFADRHGTVCNEADAGRRSQLDPLIVLYSQPVLNSEDLKVLDRCGASSGGM
jgi:hypothetical protein